MNSTSATGDGGMNNITAAELERQLREIQRNFPSPMKTMRRDLLFGMPVIESEVADAKPMLQLAAPADPKFDYVSPGMRAEMNRWLLNRFGVREPARSYIMPGFGIVVPRGFISYLGTVT